MDNLKELAKLFGNKARLGEPMKNHTNFKIGGPADLYLETGNVEDLKKAIKEARGLNIPIFILGLGTNLLVSDKGISGLVIKFNNQEININEEKKEVTVGAGAVLAGAAMELIEKGISTGLEYLASVPGTIGGAIWNNAHYKDKLIGSYVLSGTILDNNLNIKTVSHDEFKFNYDYSLLQENGNILLSVAFKIETAEKEALRKIIIDNNNERRDKQPIEFPSAGCVFKNITQADKEAKKLPTLSAGYLIEQCGLKGKRIGGAEVSQKHANFIVNVEGATSADVQTLISMCKEEVKKKFDLDLKVEIKIIGQL